jgi:hypothetical protein
MKADKPQQSKLARYFQSFRRAGIYQPNRFIFPLGAGCLVLFSFFVIPPPQYNNFEPLFAKRQPEVGVPPAQKKNSARQTRMIAVRVLGMETDGRIPEVADARQIWLMQERIGMNIFIRSGYLKSAHVVTESTGPPPPQVRYELVLDTAPSVCAALDTEESENDEAQSSRDTAEGENDADQSLRNTVTRLAISAVAVEKFHRNVLHRRMEWAYARAFSTLFGRLPDLSLGPAQIRVSRVRQIAAEVGQARGPYATLRTSDAELVPILADECKSLKLAATMMYYFLTKARASPACENENDPFACPSWEEIAAATYVGQRRKTHAVIDYGPIVARMAEMLAHEGR